MDPITETDLIDYLGGELPGARSRAIGAAVATDPVLRDQLRELEVLRADIALLPDPEPSVAADARFAELLKTAAKPGGAPARRRPAPRARTWRYAATAAALLLVFGLGWYFGTNAESATERRLAATRSLMLELMAADRSTTRMRAATVTLEVPVADPVLIANLGLMLRTDENANVRLAALDALGRFADQPAARREMLDAMAGSPPDVVRIQLMEALIRLNERRVLPYLEALIRNDSLPRPLRDAARLGTFKLI